MAARAALGGGERDSVAIEVEFVYDPESHNWAYRVPTLHITGGAETEDEALEMARESILYALTGPQPTSGATKRGYFQATVSAPKHLVPA